MSMFDTENNCFVHVATHGGKIMMVIAVHDGVVPRYDLKAIDGTIYVNIGEYELSRASDAEVEAALAAREIGQADELAQEAGSTH